MTKKKNIPVTKDDENELPIPDTWRLVLKEIADCLVKQDFQFTIAPINVLRVGNETASINQNNVDGYPDTLGALSCKTWKTSIYIWDGGYWRVLLDLSTEQGETSDLVLHIKVREKVDGFEFEPGLIYVP